MADCRLPGSASLRACEAIFKMGSWHGRLRSRTGNRSCRALSSLMIAIHYHKSTSKRQSRIGNCRYILLDRDGVINRRIADGYVTSWEQFEFQPRAFEALRTLAEHGYRALVVSNQACVSKGLISFEDLAGLTRRFVEEVE